MSKNNINNKINSLCESLASLTEAQAVRDFLIDLCTPAELTAMSERLAIVPLLNAGKSYREINQLTGISTTTIGRVARTLKSGQGYKQLLETETT